MKKHEIQNILPKFETYEERVYEAERRMEALENQDDMAFGELLDVLDSCNEHKPCRSAACPLCLRKERADLIIETLNIANQKSGWCMVTLTYPNAYIPYSDLLNFDTNKFKARLHQQLKRLDYQNIIIGSFEADYHETGNNWGPHFHLITPLDKHQLGKIRKYYSSDREMKITPIRDKPYQISYALKFFWGRIYKFKTGEKNRTYKANLESNKLATALLKQHRLGINGQLFLKGVRYKRSKHKLSVNGIRRRNGDSPCKSTL
ncbi:MAG: hypothetical protein VXY23_22765 [Pseudomonadota bacterium]|nr:hypothetical protein [Pseudomonadota bacterium]